MDWGDSGEFLHNKREYSLLLLALFFTPPLSLSLTVPEWFYLFSFAFASLKGETKSIPLHNCYYSEAIRLIFNFVSLLIIFGSSISRTRISIALIIITKILVFFFSFVNTIRLRNTIFSSSFFFDFCE